MVLRALKSAFLLVPFVLGACMDDSGSTSASVPPDEVVSRLGYTVSGDSLIIHDSTRIFRYCIGDSLKVSTTEAHDDTSRFSILGDTLTLAPRPDSLDSGLVIQEYILMIRQGAGQGFEGGWKTGPMRYRYLSGQLTPDRKAQLDTQYARASEDAQYLYTYDEFRGGILTQYADYDWAGKFILDWKRSWSDLSPGDSSPYALDLKRRDKHVVEIKGRMTGETVTITIMNNYDHRYESDAPDHPAFWYRMKPTTCPDDIQPSWYLDFLQANRQAEAPAKKNTAGTADAPQPPREATPGYFQAMKTRIWPK